MNADDIATFLRTNPLFFDQHPELLEKIHVPHPYGGRATVLERDLPCRPCSAMGGPTCPLGHHRCLTDLEPDVVFDAIRRLPR